METAPTPENAEKLDARWFKRFEDTIFDDYEKLSGKAEVREAEKKRFLDGAVENPTLDYPELETFDFNERESSLLSLKEDVLEQEQNEAIKKIYRTKINESLAGLRMLRAAKNGDDRKFSRYADFIYGKPDDGDINYVLLHVQTLIEKNAHSEDPEKVHAAQRLQTLFRDLPTRVDTGVDKSVLPKGQDIPGTLENIEEAVTAFEEALQEIGADEWSVLVDSERGISSFSVSQEDKVVHVPSEEKLTKRNISKKKLQGLIEHEIKTHVARRHNGERSKLQLLGLGLDRQVKAEEGIATYAEQQVTGAKEFAGVARFLSIALAKGVAGEPLDFRHTHSIMADYRFLSSPKKDVTLQHAQEVAYNDCVRIFRGTTCKTPGAIYPKDMAYFGNRAIWTLVSKNSDAVEKFTIGKYDPTNSEHIALLTQLGILDEELDSLEQ